MSGWYGRVRAILREANAVTTRNDLDLIAAGVAFYGLFSIFPALAATIAILGLVSDPVVVEAQLDLMRDVIPADVYAIFDDQITRLLSAGGGTLGWTTVVSVLVALWSARAGVGALMRGVNAIFGQPPRGGIRHLLAALVMTVSLIGVALVALAAVVGAPIAIALLPDNAPTARMLEGVRWIVALGVLLAALAILYRYGPNSRGARGGWLTPGAIIALVLWFGASWAFSEYLSNFGRYNEVYGSLGAVIALLMWFYISAYLILLGAVFDVSLTTRPADFTTSD